MRYIRFIILPLLLLSLSDCNTPAVSSKKPDKLYIASDFLNPEDSVFFHDFRKKEQIKVVILPMSTDSIVSHYHHFRYNSQFDMVLMKSVYSLDVLSKKEVLHTIDETHLLENKGLAAPDSDWIVLGIDPYVIGGLTEERGFQYNELTYGSKWKNELDELEFANFQAAVMFQFGRKNMKKSLAWLKKIEAHTLNSDDTITVVPYFLSRLSKVRSQGEPYVYPSQSQKFGAFYDGIGTGIVRHSSKHSAALSLIKYYSNIVYNQKLCNRLNVLPVQDPKELSLFSYQNNYPILFRCTPRNAVSLFRDLERIRKRIEE